MSCLVRWEKSGVRWDFCASVSERELLALANTFYGDSRFDSCRFRIINLLGVDRHSLSVETVLKLAALDAAAARSNANIAVAWVLPEGNQELSSLASLYCAEKCDSPWAAEIFHSLVEAELWIERRRMEVKASLRKH